MSKVKKSTCAPGIRRLRSAAGILTRAGFEAYFTQEVDLGLGEGCCRESGHLHVAPTSRASTPDTIAACDSK
eukprot:3947721-Amphidinium_carterae.1